MAELRRTLGFWMTASFVFLNLINTGIFFGVQIGAVIAGIDSLIAWTLLGAMSTYTAMCFSELSTMFPTAGGVYEFAKQAYGRFMSFQIGWLIWLINNIAAALLIVAAVTYLLPGTPLTLLGVTIPAEIVSLSLAFTLVILLNGVAYRGASESARLMVLLAIFTLVLSLIVILPGLREVHMANFRGFQFAWPSILLAAFVLSETFFGWESVTFMAEEIKEPGRTIPRALNWTTAFVSIVSVGVAFVTFGVLGPGTLGQGLLDRPLLAVLEQAGIRGWIILLANTGIVVTFLGNAAGSIIGNPRLLLALSRDRLFIEQFADVHERYGTPSKGILLQTVAIILVMLLAAGAFERLLSLLVLPSILLYMSMLVLVPYFRWKHPRKERPYTARFGSWMPFVLVLLYGLFLTAWLVMEPYALGQVRVLVSFILFSIPIYLLLTYFYDPDILITTINRFASLNLWLENVLVPRDVRNEVLLRLPDAKGKRVLELGSSVGSLTQHLARHVGPHGRVVGIDFSLNNVRIANRRMAEQGHTHVTIIHDPHLINRIHPSVGRVDMVVSVGILSYFQDFPRLLKDLYQLLPRRGSICFVEYTDLFWFLPNNPSWLSHPDRIRNLFSSAGFSVHVEVERGLFWKYLYVYGMKEKTGVPYV